MPAEPRWERSTPWWWTTYVASPPAPVDAAECLESGQWVKIPVDPPLVLVHAVARWQGALWLAGFGGVVQWQLATQQWLVHNDGLLPPQWSNKPYGIELATHENHLWLIQGNAGPQRLLRRAYGDQQWTWMSDAPTNARVFLTTAEQCYLGSADGVAQWDGAGQTWLPVTSPLDAMVTAFAVDEVDGGFYAGTAAGGLWLVDPWTQTSWAVGDGFAGSFIHALQHYGEYLYVATQGGLHRCWDLASQCEPIEPETGFAPPAIPVALTVWNGQLLLGANNGAYHFDAENDFWNALTAGFTITPMPIEAFAATSTLYTATPQSIWHWRCGK